MAAKNSIQPIDTTSVHRITSGQVVIDLQTAVKELVENSLDAGSTSIEVRFKNNGLAGVEVVDNGCGIPEKDHDSIALKHHTSKLSSYSDLVKVTSFGFRGEALSALCALCEGVSVTTSTEPPMGTRLEMDSKGKVKSRSKIARQKGTTVTLVNPFVPLPVRRKEFERHAKREFAKALNLLNAYALGPCAGDGSGGSMGVRLTVTNTSEKGQKTVQIKTLGSPHTKASVTSLWGPKALDNIVDLNLSFNVDRDLGVLKGLGLVPDHLDPVTVIVRGLISKFSVGCGRNTTDRQFFYINSRPCNLTKIQKIFNESYRSFNATQSPFIIADFLLPTDAFDVNVSPDKRTIFLHNEAGLLAELKQALETNFAQSRSTYGVNASQSTQTSESSTHKDTSTIGDEDLNPTTVEEIDRQPSANAAVNVAGNREISPQTALSIPLATEEDTPNDPKSRNATKTSLSRQEATVETLMATESPQVGTSSSDEGPERGSAPLNDAFRSKPPPRKDRASAPPPASTSSMRQSTLSASVTTTSSSKEKGRAVSSRRELKQQLIKFARTGSQKASESSMEVDEEVNSDNSSASDEDEAGETLPDSNAHPILQSSDPPDGRLASSDVGVVPDSTSDALPQSSVVSAPPEVSSASSDGPLPPEIIRTQRDDDGSVMVNFDLERISRLWSSSRSGESGSMDGLTAATAIPIDANVENVADDEKAVDALSRVIDKQDFADMQILGQFNLGFIIARRNNSPESSGEQAPGSQAMDDLFIVDQHAADEKYNFETLQRETKLDSQRLLRPDVLELTAADEIVVKDNMDIIRQNGFDIGIEDYVDDNGDERTRYLLLSQPVSKSTVFNGKDLEELISLLHDRHPGQMVRCSKARAMFAMRACRKSVMVGMPLSTTQMTTVVRHMGTIDQPWHCPHGRPTMRHLYDMARVVPRSAKAVDWVSF